MNYEKVTSAQSSYLNYVVKRDDDLRKFRHDIRAHMIIMKDLVQQGKNEEVLKYMENIDKLSKRNRLPNLSGNSTIDAIVSELYDRIEQGKILFQMKGCIQNMTQELSFDLSVCIYNLLLNSIEACEKIQSEKKEIVLELKQYQQKLYLLVKNTCEKMENQDDIKMLSTTKQDTQNHGYGSRSVKEIVQKHHGKVIYSVKDNWFVCEILL